MTPPPKKAKVAPMAPPKTHDFAPLFSLLEECNGEPSVCRQMLRAAAPFSFRTPKEHRHRHQDMLIEMMSEVFEAERESRVSSVQTTRAQLHEADVLRGRVVAQHASAQEVVQVKRQARDARQADMDVFLCGVEDAAKILRDGTDSDTQQPEGLSAALVEKERIDSVFTALWQPLKAGFPNIDQKQRATKLKLLLDEFARYGADDAFLRTFTFMTKKNSIPKGEVARKTIEFGEALLLDCQRRAEEQVRQNEDEATKRKASMDVAAAAMAASVEQRAHLAASLGTAQIELQKAQETCDAVQADLNALDEERESKEMAADAAQARLDAFGGLFAKFEGLRAYTKFPRDFAQQVVAVSDVASEATGMDPVHVMSPWPSTPKVRTLNTLVVGEDPNMPESMLRSTSLGTSLGTFATMDGRAPVRSSAVSSLLFDTGVDVD